MPSKETEPGTPADKMLSKLDTLNSKIEELKKEQTTCYGDECNRIDNLLKLVEQQRDVVSNMVNNLKSIVNESVSAVVDDKIAVIETRTNEIKASLAGMSEKPVPTNNTEQDEDTQLLDENCYIECPTCGQPLDLTKKSCKHCGTVVDWDSTLNNIARD